MHLCFFRVSHLLTGLAILFSSLSAYSQFADEPLPPSEDSIVAVPATLTPKGAGPIITATDAEIQERLSYLSSCVDLKLTPSVKSYIRTYTFTKQTNTRKMLGKRLTYFPIFEKKLKEYGLPTDLKYLSVVESALNPNAVSRVGAVGLWQFMPATGREYDLATNAAVEERSNVVKSSDAAARYLKHLYTQYNDWALALAAYNSGPTRVNSAIRRAGSRNFWKIQRYLPKETSNYVPAFIAATYICNFHSLHNLEAENPDYDEQLTDFIKVYDGMSFGAIADATGIGYAVVERLNPGFKRKYVPPSKDGYFVILPQRVMPAFVRYLNGLGSRKYMPERDYNALISNDFGDGKYYKSTFTNTTLEHIDKIAESLGYSPEHLKAWNNLGSNWVHPDQTLTLWHPVVIQKHGKARIEAPAPKVKKIGAVEPAPQKDNKDLKPTTPAKPAQTLPKPVEYQWHTVRRNESLDDVARIYNTSIDALKKLNNITTITVGTRLKVKQI